MFFFRRKRPAEGVSTDTTTPGSGPDASQALADTAATPATESAPSGPETRAAETLAAQVEAEPVGSRSGFFGRLKAGIARTREALGEGIARIVSGRKRLDAESLEDLEALLLGADVGLETTSSVIAELTNRLKRNELQDPEALYRGLADLLTARLVGYAEPLELPEHSDRPFVILTIGVNGAGKTTTIGKLAAHYRAAGRSVLLAAGDTFRAAAVQQLQAWGERNAVPVIAQPQGADPASVVHDALSAAQARNIDILIADTAGRLHTQSNLMDELKKVKRVLGKLDPRAPHETLLVIDGTAGQNALAQALKFHEAVGLSGMVVTKLDGTARGGIVFALVDRLKLPIRYIGVGEALEDLRPFEPAAYVEAMLGRTS
ncbi:MAG TPA: signal recognition particle-docking protein FtsY [Gammaproteobacteria bacterium]|nr:signal recognition particle-docking protein FtsY [Gammaproteobacteria bacterium]